MKQFGSLPVFAATFIALIIVCETGESQHADWPQWRGARFDSISHSTGLPVEFGIKNNLRWKFPMPGPAGSSPVVANGVCYVTSVAENDKLVLIAVDSSGKEKWSRPLIGTNRDSRDEANSASASPFTDGVHVWATSGAGGLSCFTAEGEEVWGLDLQEEFGEFNIQFGMSSTPVLHDGRIYLQLIHGDMRNDAPGTGIVVCLDALTGNQIWRQDRLTDATRENKHSYASPAIYSDDERTLLLTHGGDYLIAHDINNGEEVWRCGGLNPREGYNPFLRFVSSPGIGENMILAPSAKAGPVIALRPDISGDVTDDGSARLWSIAQGTPDVATPITHDGLVYLFRENGIVACIDAENGQEIWKKRVMADLHRSTPVIADGMIFCTGRDGKVVVLKCGRELEVLAENDLGETITASPAIAGDAIFVRTFRNLYCFGNTSE